MSDHPTMRPPLDPEDEDTFIEGEIEELLSLRESWDEESAREHAKEAWESEMAYREAWLKENPA